MIMKREVSDKQIIALLMILVIVSAFGVSLIYNAATADVDVINPVTGAMTSSNAAGVGLRVIEVEDEEEIFE